MSQALKKAKLASAPGPCGVPYCVYKNAPDALNLLYRDLRVVWEKQVIPKAWWRAGEVLLPKEKNVSTIKQFSQINLLNAKGKIFYSMLAQRFAKHPGPKHFINTTIKKAGKACLSETENVCFWRQTVPPSLLALTTWRCWAISM